MILVYPAAGTQQDCIFEILNEQYIDDIKELPYSLGNPQIDWQEKGNIKAWVDIVGWKNLSKDEGKYYILGDPASLAIVQYDAIGIQPGWLDSIEKTVSVTQSGNNLIASLIVELQWYTVSCNKDGCWKNHHSEEATFQDIETIPLQFPGNISHVVNVMEHNLSIEPKISIQFNDNNFSKLSIKYNDNIVIHRLKTYHVEQTEKGVFFANASNLDTWNISGTNITRFGNDIFIKSDISNFSYGALDITFSDFYNTHEKELSIKRLDYSFKDSGLLNPVLFSFLGILSITFTCCYFMVRRLVT